MTSESYREEGMSLCGGRSFLNDQFMETVVILQCKFRTSREKVLRREFKIKKDSMPMTAGEQATDVITHIKISDGYLAFNKQKVLHGYPLR